MTNIEKIVIAPDSDYSQEIVPGFVLQKIIGKIRDQEKKRYLLSILKNRDTLTNDLNLPPFRLSELESVLCACAKDHILVSVLSNPVFENTLLSGICGNEPVDLRNISQSSHIDIYKIDLGIRHYHANSVKHKADRINPYGKGKVASPMDLDDFTAQQVLNRAIFIDGRLYGRKNGKSYTFQQEQPCIFHGYIDDPLPQHISKELDKVLWD